MGRTNNKSNKKIDKQNKLQKLEKKKEDFLKAKTSTEESSESEDSIMDFDNQVNLKRKFFDTVKDGREPKKKKNESDADIVELFESMFLIQQNVIKCIMNGNKKEVKVVAEEVQTELGKISKVFGQLAGIIQTLSSRVTELEKTNVAQNATYAERLKNAASGTAAPPVKTALKSQVPRISGTRQPATKVQTVVKITPSDKGKNSDETKKEPP